MVERRHNHALRRFIDALLGVPTHELEKAHALVASIRVLTSETSANNAAVMQDNDAANAGRDMAGLWRT